MSPLIGVYSPLCPMSVASSPQRDQMPREETTAQLTRGRRALHVTLVAARLPVAARGARRDKVPQRRAIGSPHPTHRRALLPRRRMLAVLRKGRRGGSLGWRRPTIRHRRGRRRDRGRGRTRGKGSKDPPQTQRRNERLQSLVRAVLQKLSARWGRRGGGSLPQAICGARGRWRPVHATPFYRSGSAR